MKRIPFRGVTDEKQPQAASIPTRIKNTFEAYRVGVADNNRSTEFGIAKCGCCLSRTPRIDDVWDQTEYSFLDNAYSINGTSECVRVHPALWENGSCNHLAGIFEVLPGKIYQVRGYDMANITFVKTNNTEFDYIQKSDRWMVLDTLMSTECTESAMRNFNNFLLERCEGYNLVGAIVGIIVSHSHVDHYGGMRPVSNSFVNFEMAREINATPQQEADISKVDVPFILAPEGFFKHSVSENVYVGNAMGRRASYQYGSFIKPPNEYGFINENQYLSGEISIGIGQGQSTGTISFKRPTMEIEKNQVLQLDNLLVEFQLTPGTEAPAEMNNYFPKYHALWLAENCNGTLHNLYTLRGAQVRDGKAWANYLMETVALYGDDAQVIFQSHNWPHWDVSLDKQIKPSNGVESEFPKTNIREFLVETAAIYKFINDQTLLYMNMGYKMNEASDMLTLPRAMQKNWCLKPFYGTPKHNAKAVYQRYLGWYDANPLHLEELPPEILAKEQLRYLTSNKDIFEMIESDIQNGNYWIAAYMSHQIILGSSNEEMIYTAKMRCAEALEQLGYQSESGTWRNAYLSAAYELRQGKGRVSATGANMLNSMTAEMLLDYISILFDGERGSALEYDGYLTVEDTSESSNAVTHFIFAVKNGAILYYPVTKVGDNCIEISKSELTAMLQGAYTKDNILGDISKCLVMLSTDRYKYFDIMTKHDSDVRIGSNTEDSYDLVQMARECFFMLEKYVTAFNGDSAPEKISLAQSDSEKWKLYYSVLEKNAGILNCESFLATGNSDYGKSEVFTELELYYDLYCLLRYLTKPYLKNDVGYEGIPDDLEDYTKLKKIILMLETYVADCYMKDATAIVTLDTDDANAWKFVVSSELPERKMDITYFFWMLYTNYKRLSGKVNTISAYLSLKEVEANNSITLCYSFPDADGKTYTINYGSTTCNNLNGNGEISVGISDSDSYVVFEVFDDTNSFCERLIFFKE